MSNLTGKRHAQKQAFAIVRTLESRLQSADLSVSALWPATAVDSFVMEKLKIPRTQYRKSDIFADAVLAIGEESSEK